MSKHIVLVTCIILSLISTGHKASAQGADWPTARRRSARAVQRPELKCAERELENANR